MAGCRAHCSTSSTMLRQRLSSLGQRALLGARQYAAVPAVIQDLPVPESAPWANSAAVLHGVNDMRFENFPLPDRVPSGNVRIEIKAVGICGSDVHYWRKVCFLTRRFCGYTRTTCCQCFVTAAKGPYAAHVRVWSQRSVRDYFACGFVWGCKTLDISHLLGWPLCLARLNGVFGRWKQESGGVLE